eukprot:3863567-Amphidinium_carterae.1
MSPLRIQYNQPLHRDRFCTTKALISVRPGGGQGLTLKMGGVLVALNVWSHRDLAAPPKPQLV